jgi:hypothetical protein
MKERNSYNQIKGRADITLEDLRWALTAVSEDERAVFFNMMIDFMNASNKMKAEQEAAENKTTEDGVE